jgi:hypothetical protein
MIIYNGIVFKDRTKLELLLQTFACSGFIFLWILTLNARVKAWSLKAASRYGIVHCLPYCRQKMQGT